MALTLTLDDPSPIVVEPGYHRTVTAAEMTISGEPTDQNAWVEPLLQTLMLKPRQMDPSWLGTSQQLDSIIRLARLTVDSGDLTNLRVIERALGNNADPWIWHYPVGPTTAFPSAIPPMPGAPSSLVGVTVGNDIPEVDVTQNHSHDWFEPLTSVPPDGSPPTPVVIADYTDAKTIAVTQERLPANQGVLLRWFHPYGSAVAGYQLFYVFHIAQYAIHIRDVTVEVWEDISPNGDRSEGRKVLTYPMFSLALEPGQRAAFFNTSTPTPSWFTNHYRSLMFMPYRRNKVLLLASTGRAALLVTRPDNQIKRNSDNTDWVNTREDTIKVKALSPVWGNFQIQLLKYPASAVVNGPISAMEYTPASPPTLTVIGDADAGTALSGVRSSPPSYTLTERPNDDCPTPTGSSLGLISEHGVQVTLTASGSLRRTPYLYAYQINSPRTLGTSSITPLDVPDDGTDSRLMEALFSLGKGPGEGKGRIELLDEPPYDLAGHYYRSQIPLKLADGATTLFRGISEPIELTPLHHATTAPRRMVVPMVDRWKLLARRGLREFRDFNKVGHITAVLSVVELAGIDTSTAETPPINTPALDRQWNTPLSMGTPDSVDDGSIRSPWGTRPQETAASFVQRVAEQFSGWDVGFRADGTFFYLPRDWFTAVGTRFYPNDTEATGAGNPGAPLYRDPVVFTTEEPEANVIMVRSGSHKSGGVTYSPAYVDWASIKNPLAPNYLGFWRAEVVEVAGGFTCRQLDWIARTIWMQTRRRRRNVQFEATYQPSIKVGHIVELFPYGNYKVMQINAHYQRVGWSPATYSGEFQEAGF
ncbi:MAG TPA: hypothetical protein VIM84_15790 [Gemmatimonadales bacterium]